MLVSMRALRGASRFLIMALVGLSFISLQAQNASAKPAFSSIAIDARSGAILSQDEADGLRHPASLTKMMTLYIVFQELKAGRLSLKSKFRASARTANMPPSKLGLRPGEAITVEQAIKALVIKSANDVAATVGENLGHGSEAAFANRMTRTARAIGMSRTTFRNASGLPNPAQVTTARDMATLGLRLMRDFPQYYPYFRATSFSYRGRIIKTHNHLVGRFPGTDGIKTGYIGKSGFNVVTSTLRNGRRIVGVVIGARSPGSRSAYMIKMINNAFPAARQGNTIAAMAGSSKGAVNPLANLKKPAPQVAEATSEPVIAPPVKKLTKAKVAAQDTQGLAQVAALVAESSDETTAPQNSKKPKVVEAKLQKPQDSRKKLLKASFAHADSDAIVVASLPNAWGIQVSDFGSKSEAQGAIMALREHAPQQMKGKEAFTVTVKRGSQMIYRVVISGFSEKTAKMSCNQANKLGKDCAVILPQG